MTGGQSERTESPQKRKETYGEKREGAEEEEEGGVEGGKGAKEAPLRLVCMRRQVCVCACTALTMRCTDKKESTIQHYPRR